MDKPARPAKLTSSFAEVDFGEEAGAVGEVQQILSAAVESIGGAPRSGQIKMADAVWHSLIQEQHLLVQAGTGTGKSLGYLVPALLSSLEQGKKVTVATATLALQRQIMVKDLPVVTAALQEKYGYAPRTALLKGWNNYACLRKVEYAQAEEDALFSRFAGRGQVTETGLEVKRAYAWAQETLTGDRDELQPGVNEKVWQQVSVNTVECVGDKCSFRSKCFPALARAAALEADLVVTNHAMLGIQANGLEVLPPADAYIIDEAHELVDRVTEQLSQALAYYDFTSVANQMTQVGLDDAGLLDTAQDFKTVLQELGQIRIKEIPQVLYDFFLDVSARLERAYNALQAMAINTEDDTLARKAIRAKLNFLEQFCDSVLGQAIVQGTQVAWIEEGADGIYRLCLAPLDVSKDIANNLFAQRAIVLTSATLRLGPDFTGFARQVGLDLLGAQSWQALDVGSPFNYAQQGYLYVADHLPKPTESGYQEACLVEMVDLINAAQGGALGLFTSWAAMQKAAEYCREHLDFPVLVQGEDNLSALVSAYRENWHSSLFGTMSLWQGVDVSGLTNRLVIIDRIPFPRPNHPLVTARTEAAQKRGGNGFMQVSASHAALMLAQGAGRLLRTTSDLGVVAILDARLRSASYSRYLLSSLPNFWPSSSKEDILQSLARLATRKS